MMSTHDEILERVRATSGTIAQAQLLVDHVRQLAHEHSLAAEKIRPGDGSDTYMLDGVDEIEDDAIATALDERAAELIRIANLFDAVL
jgi:hypothetical protein